MKLKFSIRYKILSMVSALLLTATVLYLLLAMSVFREDKLELIYDLNKSVVSTIATEVDTTLQSSADKLKLYTLFFDKKSFQNSQNFFDETFASDPFIVRLEIFEMTPAHVMKKISKVSSKDFLTLYNLNSDFFDETLTEKRPIPFDAIQNHSDFVWNATIKDGPALLGIGLPVVRDSAHGPPEKIMAAVAYLKADLFLKNLNSSKLTDVFIASPEGRILIHANPEMMISAADVSALPIFTELKSNPAQLGVTQYEVNKKSKLGAFARVNHGDVIVISQVDGEKAFGAIRGLVRRSLLFGLIISTITFIATIFFSRSLTSPLQNLVAAMERVATGALDVALKVKTHDEIAILATSFNSMTQDLRSSRSQLEEVNRELENKVIDRTKKLEEQNRAVKEAQEALLRTTRLASVGEIAGRAAHEVLNPLTSIMARIQKVQVRLNEDVVNQKNLLGDIGSAWREGVKEKGLDGFLRELEKPSLINPEMTLFQEDMHNINGVFEGWDKDIDTLQKDTQFLLQQVARIEKILNQMRSLSVVSNQKINQPVHPILHDAVSVLGDLFSKNKIQVLEKFEARYMHSTVDRDEFIQVLTNILRNSLHAISEKQKQGAAAGLITIATSDANDKLIIDISDDGVGISKEHQQKLFESQFSTKTPEMGTGLGLSISRRFIRAFNGELSLLSAKEGGGSVFRITLPSFKEARMGSSKGEAA